jgi:outer membrane murein-binding lipoprotein Lpp
MEQSKSPTSVNLRDDHAEWMDANSINRSELINQLITQYRQSGGQESGAVRRLRMKQLETQINAKESEVELLRSEYESLQSDIPTEQEQAAETWDRALSMLRLREGYKGAVLIESPDRAVEDFADDLGMDVDAFREELKARWSDDS